MPLWDTVPFLFLGVLIVMAPLGVIGLYASRITRQQRFAFLTVYAGVVVLLGITAADLMGLLPSRVAVDVTLLVGGLAVGVLAAPLLAPHWPLRR